MHDGTVALPEHETEVALTLLDSPQRLREHLRRAMRAVATPPARQRARNAGTADRVSYELD